MQLRACLGPVLLGLGACAHIPGHLLLNVDGSTVEIKKKPVSDAPPVADPAAPAADDPAR